MPSRREWRIRTDAVLCAEVAIGYTSTCGGQHWEANVL
jgi:hypothetical protein